MIANSSAIRSGKRARPPPVAIGYTAFPHGVGNQIE